MYAIVPEVVSILRRFKLSGTPEPPSGLSEYCWLVLPRQQRGPMKAAPPQRCVCTYISRQILYDSNNSKQSGPSTVTQEETRKQTHTRKTLFCQERERRKSRSVGRALLQNWSLQQQCFYEHPGKVQAPICSSLLMIPMKKILF